jgi:hypothetical protein
MLKLPKLSLRDNCTNNSRLLAIATNFSFKASGVDISMVLVSYLGLCHLVFYGAASPHHKKLVP